MLSVQLKLCRKKGGYKNTSKVSYNLIFKVHTKSVIKLECYQNLNLRDISRVQGKLQYLPIYNLKTYELEPIGLILETKNIKAKESIDKNSQAHLDTYKSMFLQELT